jgi:hypothetical protein
LEKLLDEMQVYYLQSLEMVKETKLGRKRKMLRLGGIPLQAWLLKSYFSKFIETRQP